MSKKLILYLPGFPGEAIKREAKEVRAVDIISRIAEQKNQYFEVINYPGINSEDVFTFENTKLHSLKVIKDKISQGFSITLIGQSWGGLISLLALDQFSLDQVLLITPFLLNIPKDEIKSILKVYSSDLPCLIMLKTIEKNADDIQSMMSSLSSILQENSNQADIEIFANTQDEIIHLDVLNKLISSSNSFKTNVKLTTSINDHNFSNGFDELKKLLMNSLGRNLGTK